jgi:hypothetical protein
MLRRISLALALAGLFVGAMFALNGSASAAVVKPPVAAVQLADAAVGAVACIAGTDPHHNVKVFWTAGRVCPAGHYGIADAFSGTPGPAGPQGPKGDPGTNGLVIKTASTTLTPSSPSTVTVTVSGLPPYSATAGQAFGTNADALPTGVTFSLSAPTPALGSTTRTFTLSSVNVADGKAFTFTAFAAAAAL